MIDRGFTVCNCGVGSIIDILVGFVVDFEVLSKYCLICILAKYDMSSKRPKFGMWYNGHMSL
jgi:hypothetical protein